MNCKHCHKPIHFDGKWFHDHNLTTFCWGLAYRPNEDGSIGEHSEKAQPDGLSMD